ncbi:MAG: hypothetical protein AABY22_18665, partial [Nanoarchaeota archaeon]
RVHQENISESLREIRVDMKEFIRKENEQDTSIGLLKNDVDNVGKKIDGVYKKVSDHINDHWKWISMALGIIGIASGLITWYKR